MISARVKRGDSIPNRPKFCEKCGGRLLLRSFNRRSLFDAQSGEPIVQVNLKAVCENAGGFSVGHDTWLFAMWRGGISRYSLLTWTPDAFDYWKRKEQEDARG